MIRSFIFKTKTLKYRLSESNMRHNGFKCPRRLPAGGNARWFWKSQPRKWPIKGHSVTPCRRPGRRTEYPAHRARNPQSEAEPSRPTAADKNARESTRGKG